MDMTIRSFNFHVESLGSVRLSDLISSGPSAGKTAAATTSETSVGSSSEVNSLASFKLTESKRNIVDEREKIMENLDLKESSDMGLERNSDNINNYC
jgi:hypothetical protein